MWRERTFIVGVKYGVGIKPVAAFGMRKLKVNLQRHLPLSEAMNRNDWTVHIYGE